MRKASKNCWIVYIHCGVDLIEGYHGFLVYCDSSRVVLGCILMQHRTGIAYAQGNSRYMKRII